MQVGYYLRYDRFRQQDLTDPLWAVVVQVTAAGEGRAVVLLRGSADYPGSAITFDREIRSSQYARRTVFAPGDVPNEVVAEEARRALLGVRHG